MSTFLLDVSPTGIKHRVHVSEHDNSFVTEEYTPTVIENEILDSCQRLRSLTPKKGVTMRLGARVPIGLYTAWRKEWLKKHADTWTWHTFLAMKLNSADYKNIRTGRRHEKL